MKNESNVRVYGPKKFKDEILDKKNTVNRVADKMKIMNSVELFAGAGGLALGIAKAGFHHKAIVEWNKEACETIRRNQVAQSISKGWPLHHLDVSLFDFNILGSDIDLLAGGPPCQPFSLGGKHLGEEDARNMFPEMFRAVLELKPKAILIENVRGLGRQSFSDYFNYILAQLKYPEIFRKEKETWQTHSNRLKKHIKSGSKSGLTYNVDYKVLNAADYGVPQCRERLFIVAFRSDLNVQWRFPSPTHSFESLIHDQWIGVEYWDRHLIGICNTSIPNVRHLNKIKSLFEAETNNGLLPWKTVRDAISDLPNPVSSLEARFIPNHVHIPGARSYPGHTGSSLDAPAKTLKAGSHGVPGGENMLAYSNGKVRYFTVRECARLQTFSDDYVFPEVWGTAVKQLGNAVPVRLAEILARSISSKLNTHMKFNSKYKSIDTMPSTPNSPNDNYIISMQAKVNK